jgi:hypothetical protein
MVVVSAVGDVWEGTDGCVVGWDLWCFRELFCRFVIFGIDGCGLVKGGGDMVTAWVDW